MNQAEWTPVLKSRRSRDTVLNQVSRGRSLGLRHPESGLLIAAPGPRGGFLHMDF